MKYNFINKKSEEKQLYISLMIAGRLETLSFEQQKQLKILKLKRMANTIK